MRRSIRPPRALPKSARSNACFLLTPQPLAIRLLCGEIVASSYDSTGCRLITAGAMSEYRLRRKRRNDILGAVSCVSSLIAEYVALEALGAAIDDSLAPAPAWTPWALVGAGVVGIAVTIALTGFVWRAPVPPANGAPRSEPTPPPQED